MSPGLGVYWGAGVLGKSGGTIGGGVEEEEARKLSREFPEWKNTKEAVSKAWRDGEQTVAGG